MRTSTSSSGIMGAARPVDIKLELPRNRSGRHDLKLLATGCGAEKNRHRGARPPELLLVFHRSQFFLVADIPTPLIPLSAGNARVFLADMVYVRDERTFFTAAGRGDRLAPVPGTLTWAGLTSALGARK
ncbi:MAG TPA: hypothetical protein VFG23_16625 [Polyangia bacterium]|jgi:hypothetical protein|nr:hypothetical protein [Polyangia bacterium]